MTLYQLLNTITKRFKADPELLGEFHITMGFITLEERYSIKFSQDGSRLEAGLQEATLLLRGQLDDFVAVFDPDTADRAKLLAKIDAVPDLPWNDWIISGLMQALNLDFGDSKPERRRFDGPFPLPLRYPASENQFKLRAYTPAAIPAYNADRLPVLVADAHPEWVSMYHKAWEVGFGNLRQPEPVRVSSPTSSTRPSTGPAQSGRFDLSDTRQ